MFHGAALKAWRERQNYSKSHMAKLLNLSKGHYGLLERGIKQPSTKVISELLELTGLSSDVFFLTDRSNAISVDFLKFQARFLEAQQENLNLRNTVVLKETEIAKDNVVIYILKKAMSIANKAVQRKYSIDRYENEIINFAKESVQKNDISCDIICQAFGISVHTLKKWIGKEKLLFRCSFNEFEPVYAATPELAGESFKCIDCSHLQNKSCKGFGINIQHGTDSEINVFSIINDLIKKGITERGEQLKILKERYHFETTEATLNEYIRRHNRGDRIPDSFTFMIN